MSPKHFIMVSTMAFAISISTVMWNDEANASSFAIQSDKSDTYNKNNDHKLPTHNAFVKESLHELLGVASDEDIYDALNEGRSLVDIATDNNKDIRKVIKLQTDQLAEQLDSRYANGSISLAVYEAQKAELTAIITKSVYTKK